MYEDIKELINDSKYDVAKELIVKGLKENDNPDLWYLLFLSENNNYLDFDPNNINNSYAYNQAISLGNDDYEFEFRLYKELALMGLNKLFRLIQIGKYKQFLELLNETREINFSLSKFASAYLKEIILVDDTVKLNYYQQLLDKLYNLTLNNEVLKIKQILRSHLFELNTNQNSAIAFEENNGILTKYNGDDANVVIPLSIRAIGKKAFFDCKNIISVDIPSTVTHIDSSAFEGCVNMTNITIPNSIMRINPRAFCRCSSLKNVVLSKLLKVIDDSIFEGCSSLTHVEIPNSVTEIGQRAFYNCSSLTKIEIPQGITSINDSTFEGCSSLTDINILDTITNIGQRAFCNCSSLTKFKIPKNVTKLLASTFEGCSSLTNIIILNNVSTIGEKAFKDCSNLRSIRIPDSVTKIGEGVLSGCRKLEEVILPFVGDAKKRPSDINQYPFGYIFGSEKYVGGVETNQKYLVDTMEYIPYTTSTYYIPSTLNSVIITGGDILAGAFSNCTSLGKIVLPNNLDSIGEWAFSGCTNLLKINIPEKMEVFERGVFKDCASLKEIEIPKYSLKIIDDEAFFGCRSLETFSIPIGVKTIGNSAFMNCDNLVTIDIPYTVEKIADDFLLNCNNIRYIYHASENAKLIKEKLSSRQRKMMQNIKGIMKLVDSL